MQTYYLTFQKIEKGESVFERTVFTDKAKADKALKAELKKGRFLMGEVAQTKRPNMPFIRRFKKN